MLSTISSSYLDVLRQTHKDRPHWGNGHAEVHLSAVLAMSPLSVLDYGCGKGELVSALRAKGVPAEGYDPGISEFSDRPRRFFDLVCAFDVLEHVEEDRVKAVLEDMMSFGRRARALIDLGPAVAVLADGRNAHLTVKPAEWWLQEIIAVGRPSNLFVHPQRSTRKLDVEF